MSSIYKLIKRRRLFLQAHIWRYSFVLNIMKGREVIQPLPEKGHIRVLSFLTTHVASDIQGKRPCGLAKYKSKY